MPPSTTAGDGGDRGEQRQEVQFGLVRLAEPQGLGQRADAVHLRREDHVAVLGLLELDQADAGHARGVQHAVQGAEALARQVHRAAYGLRLRDVADHDLHLRAEGEQFEDLGDPGRG